MSVASITNVQEWLESTLSQHFAIVCEEPEVVEKSSGGMLGSVLKKSYVTYRIRYKMPGRDSVTVRHRFSEFEQVRSELRDRYHPLGIIVPALPPKHSMNSAMTQQLVGMDLQDSFLKQRSLGLTIFCENIIRIPWLRHDSTWKHFLKPASMVTTSSEPDPNNVGYLQLLGCLQQMDLPYKNTMAARIEGVKEEVGIMEKHVKLLLDRASTIQKCEKALQQAYDSFKQGFESYYESERASIKALAGRTFNNDGHSVLQTAELVSATSKGLQDLWAAKVESNRAMDEYTGLTLVTVLEQELALIDAMKDLIKYHDEIQASIAAISNKMNSAKPDALHDLQDNLMQKNLNLHMFYAGFVYFSLPLAARMRAYNMRKFSSTYVASQCAMSYTLHKACADYFTNLKVSCYHATEESNAIFSVLHTLPIPNIPSSVAEDSESDPEGASATPVEIIIPNAKHTVQSSSNDDVVATMENLSAGSHQVLVHTHRGDKIPKGLSLSKASTGMTGLYARALLHDRGLTTKVSTIRAGVKSTGESQVSAVKDADNRSNPLAMRRGSAVMSNIQATDKAEAEAAAVKAAKDAANPLASRRGSAVLKTRLHSNNNITDRSAEVAGGGHGADEGARAGGDDGYVSFRHIDDADIPESDVHHPLRPAKPPVIANKALLGDLLSDGNAAAPPKKSVWEEV